ncbi:hypothetical protein AXE65_07620 [Ventosimonas gracilis]|uniref:UPF0250 protein AXE65_07620 n=1 Tax=Ventosimonas gracilis TaxID=1680762 RepID=A0A139SIE7_9GAMM|nr:DUF493 family protein [Ventosimonas gracilis]KXU34264.1 hypothetical protein AXE65_07620 [Ventosimonas gracilis]
MSPAPKIEFPCPYYPIKVIGDSGEDFAALVLQIVQQHARLADGSRLQSRPSKNGRFQSLQIAIVATGSAQLKTLNEALRATGRVQMVL